MARQPSKAPKDDAPNYVESFKAKLKEYGTAKGAADDAVILRSDLTRAFTLEAVKAFAADANLEPWSIAMDIEAVKNAGDDNWKRPASYSDIKPRGTNRARVDEMENVAGAARVNLQKTLDSWPPRGDATRNPVSREAFYTACRLIRGNNELAVKMNLPKSAADMTAGEIKEAIAKDASNKATANRAAKRAAKEGTVVDFATAATDALAADALKIATLLLQRIGNTPATLALVAAAAGVQPQAAKPATNGAPSNGEPAKEEAKA